MKLGLNMGNKIQEGNDRLLLLRGPCTLHRAPPKWEGRPHPPPPPPATPVLHCCCAALGHV